MYFDVLCRKFREKIIEDFCKSGKNIHIDNSLKSESFESDLLYFIFEMSFFDNS